jgi:rfaE bifunctional protein nucleotidyltransferase chain/domain
MILKEIKRDTLSFHLARWRFEEKKIVFTNGVFDILHRGHIEYLAKAKEQGDILILGLNTDASVKRLKGDLRPVNDEKTRIIMLSALSFVDYIILFEEDTPLELIRQIRPAVLVKGNDYQKEEIVGYSLLQEYGGEVITIPLTEGYSTTKFIQKIQNLG